MSLSQGSISSPEDLRSPQFNLTPHTRLSKDPRDRHLPSPHPGVFKKRAGTPAFNLSPTFCPRICKMSERHHNRSTNSDRHGRDRSRERSVRSSDPWTPFFTATHAQNIQKKKILIQALHAQRWPMPGCQYDAACCTLARSTYLSKATRNHA